MDQVPFQGDHYTGDVHVQIHRDKNTQAQWIQVSGLRLTLETFKGSYYDKLQSVFSNLSFKKYDELNDLQEIFGNAVAREHYGDRKPQSVDKICERIEFNARRAFEGNPFTGFAVIENVSQKIIGFVSLGYGSQKGESQSALILNPKYYNKKYGTEAALLTGTLAHVYYLNKFETGRRSVKAPFERLAVTVLDNNPHMTNFVTKLGFHFENRSPVLNSNEQQARSLYAVEAKYIKISLSQFLDFQKVTWEVLESSN